jgi:hypothetical protein
MVLSAMTGEMMSRSRGENAAITIITLAWKNMAARQCVEGVVLLSQLARMGISADEAITAAAIANAQISFGHLSLNGDGDGLRLIINVTAAEPSLRKRADQLAIARGQVPVAPYRNAHDAGISAYASIKLLPAATTGWVA